MPNANSYADYQILSGAKHTLDASTPIHQVDFKFKIPDNMVLTDEDRRPVLAFHVRVHKQAGLVVSVNSQQAFAWSLGTDPNVKGMWSPWSTGSLLKNHSNPVEVKFSVSTQGKIDIENVVMWYQVTDKH